MRGEGRQHAEAKLDSDKLFVSMRGLELELDDGDQDACRVILSTFCADRSVVLARQALWSPRSLFVDQARALAARGAECGFLNIYPSCVSNDPAI